MISFNKTLWKKGVLFKRSKIVVSSDVFGGKLAANLVRCVMNESFSLTFYFLSFLTMFNAKSFLYISYSY